MAEQECLFLFSSTSSVSVHESYTRHAVRLFFCGEGTKQLLHFQLCSVLHEFGSQTKLFGVTSSVQLREIHRQQSLSYANLTCFLLLVSAGF